MALPEIHFVKRQATGTPYYSHKKFVVMYYMFYNFSALPSANVKRDLNVVVLASYGCFYNILHLHYSDSLISILGFFGTQKYLKINIINLV
jgi:hypothetical protein